MPAAKVVPKELLPILDRPTIQYVVEEAAGAGIDDVLLITSKGKQTIEDHFQTGGLYSIVGEVFLKHQVMARVVPMALEERWFKPALLDDVLAYEGFTGSAIAAKATPRSRLRHRRARASRPR